MVGEGVLHVFLQHPSVEKVLVINRRPCGVSHPKLEEIIHRDFFDLSPVQEKLAGYNACQFCLGVSSVGIDKEEYFRLTHTLTLNFARTLLGHNKDMVFNYISGVGTDSEEKAMMHWARIKGQTENDLMKMDFQDVYAFRPGFIKPMPGMKNTNPYYKYIKWLFPLGRKIYPKGFCTLEELGLSMLKVSLKGYEKKVLEGTDIIKVAASGSQ
ncbi:epimerase [soil metagenome]